MTMECRRLSSAPPVIDSSVAEDIALPPSRGGEGGGINNSNADYGRLTLTADIVAFYEYSFRLLFTEDLWLGNDGRRNGTTRHSSYSFLWVME